MADFWRRCRHASLDGSRRRGSRRRSLPAGCRELGLGIGQELTCRAGHPKRRYDPGMHRNASEAAISTSTSLKFADASGMSSTPYLLAPVISMAGKIGPGVRVLDVGCGNGYWAGEFARRGCTVVGIDPSPSGIDIARATYPHAKFELMDVASDMLACLGEAPFDVIVSTEVVEHLYSPHTWATGCLRALRPGGVVVVSTPYHGWLKNVALAGTGKLDRHFDAMREGGHIKFFSRPMLSRLLSDCGFLDIQFVGAGRYPFLWKSMVLSAKKPC